MNNNNSNKMIEWNALAKIQVIQIDEKKELLINGKTYLRWFSKDEAVQRFAIAQLYELGLATQEEISEAFQLHIKTVYNYVNTYKTNGIEGLISQICGPKQSWKITSDVRAKILFIVLKEGIQKYEEIQKRLENFWNLKVSIESIRQVLKENGFVKESVNLIELKQENLFDTDEQLQLEMNILYKKNDEEKISMRVNEQTEEKKSDVNINGKEKVIDISNYSSAQRIYLDELERGEYNVYGGGLLFVPLLQEYKFTSIIKRIINIETHEGYNLDEICKTLFYSDLFGFKTMENFIEGYMQKSLDN